MDRKHWIHLGPSLVLGIGIVAATFLSVLAAGSGWLVLAGPLALSLAIVGADVMSSRLRGEASGPSWASLIVASVFFLVSGVVMLRDPALVKTLMPMLGLTSWVSLLISPGSRRKLCRVPVLDVTRRRPR